MRLLLHLVSAAASSSTLSGVAAAVAPSSDDSHGGARYVDGAGGGHLIRRLQSTQTYRYSPSIVGGVSSYSLNGVSCGFARPAHTRLPSKPSADARPHLCVRLQANGLAVSGSYAYVTGYLSASLAVIDVSDPTSPSIVGNVSSSSVINYVHCGIARPAHTLLPIGPTSCL